MGDVIQVKVSIATRQGVVHRQERPYLAVCGVLRLLCSDELQRVERSLDMACAVLDQTKMPFVYQSIQRRTEKLVARAYRDAVMAVLFPHVECFLAVQVPATDEVGLTMLGERAEMMVEGSAIPDIQRIQAENTSGVIFRRQPFAF